MRVLIAALGTALALFASSSPVAAAAPMASCYGVHGRVVCNGHSVHRKTQKFVCIYVTKQMVEEAGFLEIGQGTFVSGVGFVADGTIAGLPLGALLGLIGLAQNTGGGAVLWYADTYFQPGWRCGYVLV